MGLALLELQHQLSMNSLFEKVNWRQVPVTGSHTQKFDKLIMFFQLHHFVAQRLGSFHSNKRETEQVPAKKKRLQ